MHYTIYTPENHNSLILCILEISSVLHPTLSLKNKIKQYTKFIFFKLLERKVKLFTE